MLLGLLLLTTTGCGGKGSAGSSSLNRTHLGGLDRAASVADPFENDHDPAHAKVVAIADTGVEGNHTLSPDGDEDWQTFTGTAGELVVAFSDTTAFSNQTNTQVTLYDADLNQLAFDDSSGNDPNDFDFFLAATIPANGTYYLRVSGTPGANDGYHLGTYGFLDNYEDDNTSATAKPLSFSSTAQEQKRTLTDADEDWYTFTVNTTDPVHLHFGGTHFNSFDSSAALHISVQDAGLVELASDDVGNDFSLDFIPPGAGVYYVRVKGDPSEYRFTYSFSPNFADMFEDDDTAAQARTLTFSDTGSTEDHTFFPDDTEYDWVKFTTVAGTSVSIWGEGVPSHATLYNSALQPIATSDDFQGSGQFRFDFTPGSSVVLYVRMACDAGHPGLAKVKWISNFGAPLASASDGTFPDRVRISWPAIPAADSYVVYRATTQNGVYTQIGSPTAGLFLDDMVTDRATYWYKVQGHDNGLNANTLFSVPDAGFKGLAAPATVSASDGSFPDKIRVSWSAVATATGYKVYRASTQNGNYTQLGAVTTNLQVDDATADYSLTWYKVRAIDAVGDGILSNANSGYRSLGIPAGVSATDGTLPDRVRVTWTAVPGATSYKVYRADTQAGSYSLLGTTATAPYDDIVGDTAIRFYRVVAANANTSGGFSTPDAGNANFAAPTGVAASDGTFTDHVHITWTAAPGATSYKVFRADTVNGTYVQQGTTATLDFDNTVAGPTPYFYAVKAVGPPGDSGLSAPDSGYASIAAPGNVAASDGTYADKVRVTWDSVTGATSYKVLRSTTLGGPYSQIGTSPSPQYDDPQTTGATFFYEVKTTTAAGDSAPSARDGGFNLIPSTITATDGTLSDRINVSWPAAPGATSYKVYRSLSAGGTYTLILTTAALSFDQTSSVTTPFFFKLQASNATSDSVFSNVDSGFVGQAAPTNVAASDGTLPGQVQITWTAPSGATGYKILRATSANGAYSQIGTTGNTQFTDTVPAGTVFFYKLRATSNIGDSYFSAIDSGFGS